MDGSHCFWGGSAASYPFSPPNRWSTSRPLRDSRGCPYLRLSSFGHCSVGGAVRQAVVSETSPGGEPPTISRHPYARIVITERRVVGVEPRILCGVLGFNATETPVLGGVLSLNDAQPATCALVLVLGPFGAFAEMT